LEDRPVGGDLREAFKLDVRAYAGIGESLEGFDKAVFAGIEHVGSVIGTPAVR
jgi:hypothetical protein